VLNPSLGSGPARSGGFYTKDMVRTVVDFARSHYIEVIPEIDFPGHCNAAVRALPQVLHRADLDVSISGNLFSA
jgi:hexosaminidase